MPAPVFRKIPQQAVETLGNGHGKRDREHERRRQPMMNVTDRALGHALEEIFVLERVYVASASHVSKHTRNLACCAIMVAYLDVSTKAREAAWHPS